jgi:glycosyltransferase involved in cell wall biosynthesis
MLAQAIASVQAQTFTDCQIIVVSNGENAATRQVSRAVAADHGCVYIELDVGNVSAARNAGIKRARGEWVAFLDDDDLWLPDKLERQIVEAQWTGADMITCDWVNVFSDGSEVVERVRPPKGWPYVKALGHYLWCTLPSGAIVRKNVFDEIGDFDVRQSLGEDQDMWRRISWRHAIHQTDEILVRRRIGHPSLTRENRKQQVYEVRHYFKMYDDTPPHLRFALAPMGSFVLPRLMEILAPNWLLDLFHRAKPRTRWVQFCHRLSFVVRGKS